MPEIREDTPSVSDPTVLERAVKTRRALLTFDSDFGTLSYRDGLTTPWGIIYCRLQLFDWPALAEKIIDEIEAHRPLGRHILVISKNGSRLRELPPDPPTKMEE